MVVLEGVGARANENENVGDRLYVCRGHLDTHLAFCRLDSGRPYTCPALCLCLYPVLCLYPCPVPVPVHSLHSGPVPVPVDAPVHVYAPVTVGAPVGVPAGVRRRGVDSEDRARAAHERQACADRRRPLGLLLLLLRGAAHGLHLRAELLKEVLARVFLQGLQKRRENGSVRDLHNITRPK